MDSPGSYCGRYAPSPTGDLHLGNAMAAVCAWARARAQNGRMVLRMEDLDQARTVVGADLRIEEDLAYLGMQFDAGPQVSDALGPYVQSQCQARYAKALRQLQEAGRLYACRCSRRDLQRLASAPHEGEEGPAYPGTCRNLNLPFDDPELPVSWRFITVPGEVRFVDALAGPYAQEVSRSVGDFVVRRKDSVVAYQLAVVVDDAHQQVSEVVRGRDLLSSTPRQIQLFQALGKDVPAFAHLPLWLNDDGVRMAKRKGAGTLRGRREEGATANQILGVIGRALGVCQKGEAIELDALCHRLTDDVLSAPSITDQGPILPGSKQRVPT